MIKVLNNNCQLCGASEKVKILSLIDHVSSLEKFDISQCLNCSFAFTENAPNENLIAKYYEGDYYISHSDSQEGFIYKTYHIIRQIMLRRKKNLIKNITTGNVLLDVGTGTGYFLNFMNNNGYNSIGIEADKEARKFVFDKFNLDVHPTNYLDGIPEASVDVITMWHVLEHVHDFKHYLKRFHEILKPDGIMFLALPNMDSVDAKFYGAFWAGYDVPRHLWHFSPNTMRILLKEFDFEMIKIKALPFDPFHNALHSENFKGGGWRFLRAPFIALWSLIVGSFNAERSCSPIYIIKKKG